MRVSPALADDCGPEGRLQGVEEVLAGLLAAAVTVPETEVLPTGSALGRVTAEDIVSALSLPPFDNSAVDGYGIATADIARPVSLRLVSRIVAGSVPAPAVGPGEAVRIMTGAPVPPGIGAVVAEEYCRIGSDGVSSLREVFPGANIRRRGEDVAPGTVMVAQGTVIDARHVAMLAAGGCASARVRRRIRVALVSTGNELREVSESLAAGQIHDVNRPMLRAMLSAAALEVADFGICPDEPAALARVFASAVADADIVVASGGASGSEEDHVAPAIQSMGGEVRQHRLAIKPGKPLVTGRVAGKVLLVLPGNPFAAMVNFMLFGRPLLAKMMGAAAGRPAGQMAVCDGAFAHAPGRTEFVPAEIRGRDDLGRPIVGKLGKGGSARLRPLVLADGLAEIPAEAGDLPTGSPIVFHPFRGETAI